MEFNYATERKKFEKNWAKTEALYRKHGMTEEAIQEMHEYDWDLFKAARIEALHTQEMDFQPDEDDDTAMMDSPLLKKFFDRLTTQYDTYGTHSRFWWIEEISDPRITRVLCKLSDLDKTLLTMVWIEGYTQADCAVILHMDRGAISMRIHRILSKIAKNTRPQK